MIANAVEEPAATIIKVEGYVNRKREGREGGCKKDATSYFGDAWLESPHKQCSDAGFRVFSSQEHEIRGVRSRVLHRMLFMLKSNLLQSTYVWLLSSIVGGICEGGLHSCLCWIIFELIKRTVKMKNYCRVFMAP
jgi:hypothetical protein